MIDNFALKLDWWLGRVDPAVVASWMWIIAIGLVALLLAELPNIIATIWRRK